MYERRQGKGTVKSEGCKNFHFFFHQNAKNFFISKIILIFASANNKTGPADSGKRLNTKVMKTTIEEVKRLAKNFLALADSLNEAVSRYFDYSDAPEDVEAYGKVREADRKFIDALNSYYDESFEYGLNYELAESFCE